jgi:predicted dienelactone hydrolase
MEMRIVIKKTILQSCIAIAALAWPCAEAAAQMGATPTMSPDVPAIMPTPGAIARLPDPSGPFGIGRIGYEWIDASRPDSFSLDPVDPAASRAPRDLMVYLWYPTSHKTSNSSGIYLPGAKQIDANPEAQSRVKGEFGPMWPQILNGQLKSHAQKSAAIATSPATFPVIIFSHGLGSSGFEYTSLIEDLVSRGYIVAAIEHTYTGFAVLFPDGRVVAARKDSTPPNLTPDQRMQRMMTSAGLEFAQGAGDVLFVLNKLATLNAKSTKDFPLAGRLDLSRLAAMGHSAGGSYAARACQLDARFRACISLDGALPPVSAFPEFPDKKRFQQPVLLLEVDHTSDRMPFSPEQYNDFLKIKDAELKLCPPGSYDVLLKSAGIYHGSFSDYKLLAASGKPLETEQALHNLNLIESFTRAFLDKSLNHTKEPLLDNPPQSTEAKVKEYSN